MPLPSFYFDLESGGEEIGRIVMEQRSDMETKNAENFRAMFSSEKYYVYKGWPNRRVIPFLLFQSSDFTNHNDENFNLKRIEVGVLPMVKTEDTIKASQFVLCTDTEMTKWRDKKSSKVFFGEVVEGMDIVKKTEQLISTSGNTNTKIIISNCGCV